MSCFLCCCKRPQQPFLDPYDFNTDSIIIADTGGEICPTGVEVVARRALQPPAPVRRDPDAFRLELKGGIGDKGKTDQVEMDL